MTILRVQRSLLGAVYRSPLGVRGRTPLPEPEVIPRPLPWNIWVGRLGGGVWESSLRLQQRLFYRRLIESVNPELRAILKVPVRMVASGTGMNPLIDTFGGAFNGSRWIRNAVPSYGINVVLLYGGRQASTSSYFRNYNCGVTTPPRDLSQISIDSLANNPPTKAEAEAWFDANFASHYAVPTNANSSIDSAQTDNLARDIRWQKGVFDGTKNSNKIIFIVNLGVPGPASPQHNSVFLIRAFLNSNAPISTYRINPGVVSSADIHAGSYTSQGCEDWSIDMSGATMSLFQQIVAMNPATDPRFKWIISGSTWDYETLDAATLISLVQPHL